MKRQKFILLFSVFLPLKTIANIQPDHIEQIQNIAKVKLPEKSEIEINRTYNPEIPISILSTNNLDTTERLINQALQTQQFDVVKKLLTIYQRIELAKALFFDKQDNNAREQFQKAQAVRDIPQPIN